MDFTLNTNFTNEQLSILYATGNNVVVAHPLDGSIPNVAWQVYRPLQSNSITWDESYGIYASTTPIQNGARLTPFSKSPNPSVESKLYTLEPSGVISGPEDGGFPNAYSLLNEYSSQPYITAGLYQNAVINGLQVDGNSISASPTILKSTAAMVPSNDIYIWLQSQVVSNTIVTVVTSPMTRISFGGGVTEVTVAYDSASGQFIPVGGNLTKGGNINYIEASL